MKRIATIQDISCFGKCSITVSLPVISAMGVECAIVPTTVLSTHTAGFTGYTVCDISDQLLPIAEHWKKEGISLDTLYTGYLANETQINDTIKFIEMTKNEDTLVFVDPAMADNGKLYPGFPSEFPSKMLELVKTADVVCPNITEACLLLGKEFKNEGEYDEGYIKSLVDGFVALGIKKVVITGVKTAATDGKYVIPETLDGKKVIAIMALAFCDNNISNTVKTVFVPSTVKTIWNNAFATCYNLTDIYFKGTSTVLI